jgi:regulatory protein
VSRRSSNQQAVGLLARREHSASELRAKLETYQHDDADIEKTLDWLQKNDLQSDSRFTEDYIRHRSQRGCGELRIRQELKQRGVNDDLIAEALRLAEIDWFALAVAVRCKRFGEQTPADFKERAKQQRFLQYRGFTHEQITESFNHNT